MNFYLDTNICIEYLKTPSDILIKHFQQYPCERIKIPAVVRHELIYGAFKSQSPRVKRAVEEFLSSLEMIPFCGRSADMCARIRYQLESQGQKIGILDTMIAAIVLVNHGILVTNNTKEFVRVPDLRIQDWMK